MCPPPTLSSPSSPMGNSKAKPGASSGGHAVSAAPPSSMGNSGAKPRAFPIAPASSDGSAGATPPACSMNLAGSEAGEMKPPEYPRRPGVADCSYYAKFGTCGYGMKCWFNHPPPSSGSQQASNSSRHNKQQYFSEKACNYNHHEGKVKVEQVKTNFLGLPLRPSAGLCSYYMKRGACKFGTNCKYHHPDPKSEQVNSNALVHVVEESPQLKQEQNEQYVPLVTSPTSGTSEIIPTRGESTCTKQQSTYKGQERSSESQKEGPCSSSPSVSTKKPPPQMVTPFQPPKPVDSPPQMVTPVQPPESADPLNQLFASVQITKSLDSGSTSCASGSVVSDPGAAPFDICRVVSKCSVEVKPSLLEINREKRRAKELAKSGNALQLLRPGMVLLKNFLEPNDQVKIIRKCRELGVGTGGFYQPSYRDGAKLSLRMMCFGKNWDPDSCSYGEIRPFDGAQPPKIPEELIKFVNDAIEASHAFLKQSGQGTSKPSKEIPPMSPDICIANFYTTAGKLGLHQDKDEEKSSLTKGLPVVSFSLGDTAEFLYGDTRDEAKASKIKLESGDVLIFGGQSRNIFHGVSRITEKTAPTYVTEEAKLRPGRLNLTFRQYK